MCVNHGHGENLPCEHQKGVGGIFVLFRQGTYFLTGPRNGIIITDDYGDIGIFHTLNLFSKY